MNWYPVRASNLWAKFHVQEFEIIFIGNDNGNSNGKFNSGDDNGSKNGNENTGSDNGNFNGVKNEGNRNGNKNGSGECRLC